MIPKLNQYKRFGKDSIERLKEKSEPLHGKKIVNVNATAVGGGVAEILNTLVFLMNDCGIEAGWRVILGSHSFFNITKQVHNSLQGKEWTFTENRKKIYFEYCERNSIINHLDPHDCIIIHDPQPLGMIRHYKKKSPWIWRCHIDLSSPYQPTMDFFTPIIGQYDAAIVSCEQFKIPTLQKPQYVVPPSIDPLSTKNKPITHEKAQRLLAKKGIDPDVPILCQVSRFDRWKDPFGLIKIFQKIKEKSKCQLILMGDVALDDPEGPLIYHKVKKKTEEIKGITLITEKNDLLVNVLQQESVCAFQNSLREGFALTVSEALWKGTPVIGTPVGGIPLQIKDGETGFIIKNKDEAVKRALQLLNDRELREKLGKAGHEHVRKNFLITRHLEDYLTLMNEVMKKSEKNNAN